MIWRMARAEDRAALQALWELCFCDEPAVSGAFYDAFPPQAHTLVMAADDRVAAMVNWMPVTLCADGSSREGAYIYAVATHPEFRGQGLCRALMRESEQLLYAQGAEFAALWPASASLFGFYGAMGYEPAFSAETRRAEPAGKSLELTELLPEEYRRLRECFVPRPFCRWDSAAFSYLAATQVRFYRFAGGCGACFPLPDGGIRVPELLGAAPEDFCAALGVPYGIVTIPDTEGKQGMIKWRGTPCVSPSIHLGFAFD